MLDRIDTSYNLIEIIDNQKINLYTIITTMPAMSTNNSSNFLQNFARITLGLFMVLAVFGHFTFQREEFQAQVPDWIPLGKDLIVILSGVVELSLGLAMIFWKKQRTNTGLALAIFYVLIFPGNIAQYINEVDAFGLDTNKARLIRLFFQPVLIIWALWSTGAFEFLKKKYNVKDRLSSK